jgi:hypothetical protein
MSKSRLTRTKKSPAPKPSGFRLSNTSLFPVLLLNVTLFLGGFLVFWYEPMVAKMILPMFGGFRFGMDG